MNWSGYPAGVHDADFDDDPHGDAQVSAADIEPPGDYPGRYYAVRCPWCKTMTVRLDGYCCDLHREFYEEPDDYGHVPLRDEAGR